MQKPSGSEPHTNPEAPGDWRNFRLDEVLTAITGTNFLKDEQDGETFTKRTGGLLSFVTGEDRVATHQIPRLADEVKADILRQHPELVPIVESMPAEPPEDAQPHKKFLFEIRHNRWYMETRDQLYDRLEEPVWLTPLRDPGDHTHIDPAEELRLMGGIAINPLDELVVGTLGNAQAGGPAVSGETQRAPQPNDPAFNNIVSHYNDGAAYGSAQPG